MLCFFAAASGVVLVEFDAFVAPSRDVGGSGLRDFERGLETLRRLRNKLNRFLPLSSSPASELSEAIESAEVGRMFVSPSWFSSDEWLPYAVCWFLGAFDTIPSNERNGPFAGDSGASCRIIRSRRPGAGLQGVVEGSVSFRVCATSCRYR